MKEPLTFTAVIQAGDRGGAYVAIPYDVEKTFGKKRVKVKALIDDYHYRGLLVRMKTPHHILGIKKEVREAIDKDIGDEVTVQLTEDTEVRVVAIPEDLARALAPYPDLETFFRELSYTHQKEYVQWIESAKKIETRTRRISKAIQMMREGKKGV